MLKDCIEILKEKEKKYKINNPIEFYTDAYLLDEGIYFLVDLTSLKYKKMIVRKVKNKDNNKENEYEPINNELYNIIKILDFLSQPISARIKIDTKRLIDTTNCFSVGFKKEQISKIKEKNILTEYFTTTKAMLEKWKENELKNTNNCLKDFEEYENYIVSFKNITEKIIEENYSDPKIKNNDYIKIFADIPINKYKILKNIYYENYAFLEEQNSYSNIIRKNRKPNNKIPVNFISTNEKKPFNANKSRKVPSICYENKEEREDRDLLSKYLKLDNKTSDFEKIYIEVKNDKQKGFGFEQYIVLPNDNDRISFNYDNYLNIDSEKGTHNNRIEDVIKIFENCFNPQNLKNVKTNNEYSRVWNILKDDLLWWQKTGIYIPLKAKLHFLCIFLMQFTICNQEYVLKNKIEYTQFNLFESVLTFFITQEMKKDNKTENEINNIKEQRKVFFMDLYETIKHKIGKTVTENIDNDKEFFFIAGQITKYLILKSNADNITDSFASRIFACKKTENLRNEIINLFDKYQHALVVLRPSKNKNIVNKFSNLSAMFFKYIPNSKFVDKRLLLAGYLNSLVTNENAEKESEEINEY